MLNNFLLRFNFLFYYNRYADFLSQITLLNTNNLFFLHTKFGEKELKSLTGIGAGVHVDRIKKSNHKFDFKFNQDCPGVSFQKDEKSVTQILGHFFTFFNFLYSYILY